MNAEDSPRDADLVIPSDRLPPGFAESVDRPAAEAAPARPAATAVLLRDHAEGMQVLLLRRSRASGFVPGAYVFPGGRVDGADADPALFERADGLPPAAVPDAVYWTAAAREVFEETGVLLARDASGAWAPDAAHDPRLADLREELLADRITLLALLQSRRLRLDLRGVVYCAHWITPLAEPRRYDTRFFLAALPEDRTVAVDPREMTHAVWLTPAAALTRFADGELPMVFPTVRTLESIAACAGTAAALEAFRTREIPAVMPRLVRTADGVGIVVD